MRARSQRRWGLLLLVGMVVLLGGTAEPERHGPTGTASPAVSMGVPSAVDGGAVLRTPTGRAAQLWYHRGGPSRPVMPLAPLLGLAALLGLAVLGWLAHRGPAFPSLAARRHSVTLRAPPAVALP